MLYSLNNMLILD